MTQYISKSALTAKIEKLKNDALQKKEQCKRRGFEKIMHQIGAYNEVHSFLDTMEVKDPYEHSIQYASIEAGIQAHAETYSFNIESELFNQLTKEQQVLWRKEIEQACISGGDMGYSLAKDIRYKENLEAKEVNLDEEIEKCLKQHHMLAVGKKDFSNIAKHFFDLGLKAHNGTLFLNDAKK